MLAYGEYYGRVYEVYNNKGYIVNSCLAPPLNTDNEAVSHSATCSTNLLWVSWGVVMLK